MNFKKNHLGFLLAFLTGTIVVLGYVIHQKSMVCNILIFELEEVHDDLRQSIYYLGDRNNDTLSRKKLRTLDTLYKSKVQNSFKYHPYLACFDLQHAIDNYQKLITLNTQLNAKLKLEPDPLVFATLKYNKSKGKYDADYYEYQDSSKYLYTKVGENYFPVYSIPNAMDGNFFLRNPVTEEYRPVKYVKFDAL